MKQKKIKVHLRDKKVEYHTISIHNDFDEMVDQVGKIALIEIVNEALITRAKVRYYLKSEREGGSL